jgi:hypothetical protein
MNSAIVHYQSPGEQELARKRAELAILQVELTDREMLLENLRLDLAAFEGRYLREVGVLYAELDGWNAKIAEFAAEEDGSEEVQAAAAEARVRADESYAAAHGEEARATAFNPSPELKKLYREVVGQIHPDRSSNDSDRLLRERLMKEANAAYRREDAEALRRILVEYRSSPESVQGVGAAADLQRILRQIAQISKRLAAIETEVADLKSSEIALLMAKVETAATSGRNLFADMAKDVQRRIVLARRTFEVQSSSERTAR